MRQSWTREQSLAIAMWVLAHHGRIPARFAQAIPQSVHTTVNCTGPARSVASIVYHLMGYERLFSGRVVDINVTRLQRDVASQLFSEGVAQTLHAVP